MNEFELQAWERELSAWRRRLGAQAPGGLERLVSALAAEVRAARAGGDERGDAEAACSDEQARQRLALGFAELRAVYDRDRPAGGTSVTTPA